MKSPTKRPKLLLTTLATLCLLSFGSGFAQSLLSEYQDAAAALKKSVSAFSTDQVASLDALRRAQTAFTPLGQALEPSLRKGLQETFGRAEEAIVNQSETDLQVQAAVLQGGFGRAVYRQALRDAADGDAATAQTLLNTLSQDLGLEDTQFTGTSQRELQSRFEAQLARRGLTQLAGFGGDLGSRYRTLAQVYGYLFLVQDSPRLPPETRDTVVGTIRALVNEQPTKPGVTLLRAQLSSFARRAERAEAGANSAAQADTAHATQNSAQSAQSLGSSTAAGSAETAVTNTPTPAATPSANEPSAEPFVPTVAGAALTEDLASTADAPNAALPSSSVPADPTQDAGQTELIAAFPFLTPELYTIFLMAAGFLALVALLRLLFAPSLSPWQDAALALLLLPAVAEGLVALAGTLAPPLQAPFLEHAAAYSLFVSPLMQLIWILLTALAVLCLAVSWRAAPARREETPDPRATEHEDEPTHAERAPTAAPQQTQATRSAPLTTGNLNWDDDF